MLADPRFKMVSSVSIQFFDSSSGMPSVFKVMEMTAG
ncbi:hypothetical protein J2S08_002188 [Bacillus chungangensis]|uniref:Uncharacterized protein n=1 Tax=Bacillus chungangensis TaxID=587633 RepID=A0ABT9WTA2_9BACI|nr:hypothetical protein [Bacillus chungangensis]